MVFTRRNVTSALLWSLAKSVLPVAQKVLNETCKKQITGSYSHLQKLHCYQQAATPQRKKKYF